MTRLGVRGRLFTVSVLLILLVGAISAVYLEVQLRSWLRNRMEGELATRAEAARTALEVAGLPFDAGSVQPLAVRLGSAVSARVTVLDAGGRVVGDSQLSLGAITDLEPHDRRPEVVGAEARGAGVARRHSDTLHTDMLYVAVPFTAAGEAGVVRVATALEEVDEVVTRMRWMLVVASLVGLVVALVMSFLASHLLSRGLRDLLASARSMLDGPVSEGPTAPHPPDEIAGIASSLTHLGTALEEVVETLAHERDRFEGILEAMAEAVIALDAQHRVTLINGAGLQLLGLETPPNDEPLLDALTPPLREALAPVLSGRAEARDIELEGRQLQARITPQRGDEGIVMVLHDVTRLRRLETMRRDFVANVSHELRTPVSVICLNAETLRDGALADRKRAPQFLDAMLRNAERLRALVSDLLDISRIESGKFPVHPETIPLGVVARRAIESVEKLLEDKAMRLEVRVDPRLVVRADAKALEHVLINLLENAVKYTPETGHVELVAHREDDRVRIEVRDDGPGIPTEHRSRIFERFYRVDPGRAKHMGGTGLGLSIVKHLVASMEGAVGVEANSPHGAVFWLTLPGADGALPRAAEQGA